jgi:dGTP triphosphohydrolase
MYFENDCLYKLNTIYDYFDKNYDDILDGKRSREVDKTFCDYLKNMSPDYFIKTPDKSVIITDYISGMSDNYALACYDSLLR